MKDQVDAVSTLVKAGFDPDAALKAAGLPPIQHTGNIPVTVQQVGPVSLSGSERLQEILNAVCGGRPAGL